MRPTKRMITLMLLGLAPVAARAGQLPDTFTLGKFVPGNAWVYVHHVENPEREWVNAQWDKVFDAFKASGIMKDVTSLILSTMGDQDRTEAQAQLDKWTGLIQGVNWDDLVGKEFVYAQRVGDIPAMYEYFLLTRGNAGTGEANMKALTALLQEIAKLTDKIELSHEDRDGVTVWSMGAAEAIQDFPFSLELFRKGDVIGLTSSKKAIGDVLALMAGKSDTPAITATPRFREALSRVPSPEDGVSFFDAKLFFGDLNRMMEVVGKKAGDDEDAARALGLSRTILSEFDVMDYAITSSETDGRRELAHEISRLKDGKQKGGVCRCLVNRKAFARFDQYIPVDATGFSLDAFVDLEALYDYIIDFVKTHVPEGETHIAEFKGLLAGIGFDIERDLFSWWSGENITVSLPAAVVSPFGGGGDFVWMSRVKDTAVAQQKLDQFLNFVSGLLKGQGQSIMITPAADVHAEGFKQVTHPMVAMFFRPVIGVAGDWLVLASNPTAINKCLDVAADKAPSIAQNARFKAEGLTAKTAVRSASFTDTSHRGQELGAVAGMIGMFGGMATASIPDEGDGKQAKAIVQKALGILMKLGPVLQKIDFFSSEASVGTYDGETMFRTEKVVTYKGPEAHVEKSAERP